MAEWVEWADLDWIEYRAVEAGGTVLLDIFHDPRRQTVTVDLWRPGQVASAVQSGSPRRAAALHLSVAYDSPSEPERLARDVSELLGSMLPPLLRRPPGAT